MVVGQHTFNLYSYRTNKLTLLSISSITPGQTKGFKEIGLNHSIRLIIGTVPLQGNARDSTKHRKFTYAVNR